MVSGQTDLHIAVRHPFDCQGGPCESVGVQGVVQVRCVLLPDLILLKDALLLNLVGVVNCVKRVKP